MEEFDRELLAGESASSDDLDEIREWLRIYSLLAEPEPGVRRLPTEERERRDRRLRFWRNRYRERRGELA